MPICTVCKERIDLTKKYERVYKCSKCGKAVCRQHYEESKKQCYNCAGKGFVPKKRSFVRRVRARE
jgi:DNA-directed RNA polymerase subunit RPC12/RpoP